MQSIYNLAETNEAYRVYKSGIEPGERVPPEVSKDILRLRTI